MTDIPNSIIRDLESKGVSIDACYIVTGGDINEARKIITAERKAYFLKYNSSVFAPALLASELSGLDLLDQHNIVTPSRLQSQVTKAPAYLLLDWIETGQRDDIQLAKALTRLHLETNLEYGLGEDNFIGSLPQKNNWFNSFSDFYITTRIAPQVQRAYQKGFNLDFSLENFQTRIEAEIPNERPTLIHGDLWSGNLMDSISGPVFIDPSVSYAHREMDLAMMCLFGGFSLDFFENYNSLFPLEKGWKQRSDLFQLYYLLVHLNLFGAGYLNRVSTILSKYR